MKLTMQGDPLEIFKMREIIISRGVEFKDLLNKAQMFAKCSEASASKADIAARNAEMAFSNITNKH